MLRILLCDDDSYFLSIEQKAINKIIKNDKINAILAGTLSSASEVLTYVRNNPGEYLIFLDIDFGIDQPNGIDISSLLKKHTSFCKVVFCTNHYEVAMNVLKSGVEPFGFLEKGTDIFVLCSGFRRYINMALRLYTNHNNNSDYITLKVGSQESVNILLSDILYLESEKSISHGITYHTINGSKITVISTLDNEINSLGEAFLRVHRSYIVRKDQMVGIKDGYIVMSERSEIPCSFKIRSEVRKWLKNI